MTIKNKVGKPPIDPYQKRFKALKFSQAEIDAFNKLGLNLNEGVRLAVSEFLARNSHHEKY